MQSLNELKETQDDLPEVELIPEIEKILQIAGIKVTDANRWVFTTPELEVVVKDFYKARGDLQAQYRNTNIESFLNDIFDVFALWISGAYRSLYYDCLNLPTAKGDILECWGFLLGRVQGWLSYEYLPPETLGYNFFNFDYKNYVDLVYFNSLTPNWVKLQDDNFRWILLYILQGYYVYPSIANLEDYNNFFFEAWGGSCLGDTTDMSFLTLWTFEELPAWVYYLVQRQDFLLRPACVGLELRMDFNRTFGFETRCKEYNRTRITNFYQGNFQNPLEIQNPFFDYEECKYSSTNTYTDFKSVVKNNVAYVQKLGLKIRQKRLIIGE